jgi:hypothetical protein
MMRRLLLVVACLACWPALAQDPPPETWQWRGAALAFPEGKQAAWLPPKLLRLYQVVEDDQAAEAKALRVMVDARALQEGAIPILRSPDLAVPVGTYKVTARLKMTGMLNVIGNGIRFNSAPWPRHGEPDVLGHQMKVLRYWEPSLHGYHFAEEDVYQEFSYLVEVAEPNEVTLRPQRPGGLNPFGAIIPKADLEAWKKGEGTPWERKAKADAKPAPTDPAELAKLRQGRLNVQLDFLPTEPLGFGRVQPSMRHVTVDWLKVERQPEPARLVLRQILPTKLWLRPGDETAFDVWLHNRSGAPRQGTVRVKVQHGVTGELAVAERQVELPDHGYRVERVAWTAPATDLWGCTAVAELIVGGEVVGRVEEYFSVHRNPWAVQNHSGANRWRDPYYRLPGYRNYVEMFGGTPGDGLKPFPDDPAQPYVSGMSGYTTHMDVQKMYVEHNKRIGVASFLYIQPANGTSVFPQLLYEQHPDWFSGSLEWNDQMHDKWEAAIADLRTRWNAGQPIEVLVPPGLLHIEAPLNYGIPWIYDNLAAGAIANVVHVGWDGIRWDADFPVRTVTNKHQPYGPGSPAADRQLSAELTKRFKAAARAKAPWYTEGANIGTPEQVWNRKYEHATEQPPTDYHDAFLADGSSAMAEDWMSAWIFTDARNVIADYYWGARRCVEWCRQRGGFWHSFPPDRDATPFFTQSMFYYNLLIPLAGGSYPGSYSCTPGSDTGIAQFVTRASEFLYDLELQPLPQADELVKVDADQELWYADGTRWRDLPDGRRRYVIPLINPPTIERFLLRDRFSELPEPLREPFPVEIELPAGFRSARAFMITAEPRTAVVELKAEVDGDLVTVEVPELVIYRLLVVEFSKEAAR